MNDFALVAIILAFFALAVLFVRACDRIIGPEEEGAVNPAQPHEDRAAA